MSSKEAMPRAKCARPLPKIWHMYKDILTSSPLAAGDSPLWRELFLLCARADLLRAAVDALSDEQLRALKSAIGDWGGRCWSAVEAHGDIRAYNAIITLSALIRTVGHRLSSADGTLDRSSVEFILGDADIAPRLLARLCGIVCASGSQHLQSAALHCMLSMATACDNVDCNCLVELMCHATTQTLFDAVVMMTAVGHRGGGKAAQTSRDATALLALVLNYRKHDGCNACVAKLAMLDDDRALNCLSGSLSTRLAERNAYHRHNAAASTSHGDNGGNYLTGIAQWVGGVLSGGDQLPTLNNVVPDIDVLLCLYEAVHLNRNFVATLTSPPPATVLVPPAVIAVVAGDSSSDNAPPSSPATGRCCDKAGGCESAECAAGDANNAMQRHSGPQAHALLLPAFLMHASVLCQNLKHERSYEGAKLSFIILTCIVEDAYTLSVLHDTACGARCPLYRLAMRQRRGGFDTPAQGGAGGAPRTMASAILALCTEFTVTHMTANGAAFPHEIYGLALGCVHRLLCYEKKCAVRLSYDWQSLWNALIGLIRFLVANESALQRHFDVLALCQKVVLLFNVFITYGDTFLPSPLLYDQLYYEIVRQSAVFHALRSTVMRRVEEERAKGNAKCASGASSSASRLSAQMDNVAAIGAHYKHALDNEADNGHAAPALTQHTVLQVVRENYGTLKLRLYDNLDNCTRYSELHSHRAFFDKLVRDAASARRRQLDGRPLDYAGALAQLPVASMRF